MYAFLKDKSYKNHEPVLGIKMNTVEKKISNIVFLL